MTADFGERRALEEVLHVEVHGKETRHDCPLHLEKILSERAVEGALISGTQGRALLPRREVDIGNVAQGLERFIGAGEVRGPKQDIEIGELAQGKIAVRSFRQHWALIGDRIDGMCFKAIENANQFADENEIAACIVLVARTQFIPNRGRNPFSAIAKRKVHERRDAMMLGEVQHASPVDGPSTITVVEGAGGPQLRSRPAENEIQDRTGTVEQPMDRPLCFPEKKPGTASDVST